MNKNVAGVSVPQSMIDKISKAEDKTKTGNEICSELIKQLRVKIFKYLIIYLNLVQTGN